MPRRRLGVALIVPPPAAGEIQGLRRACGDPLLDRVVPHLTLVPPVNVRADQLPAALAAVRVAAGALGRPLELDLGPPASFHPVTPVLFLSVGGSPAALEALHRLRAGVFAAPLARPLTHPFHPHVTLGDEVADERLSASLAALERYRVTVTFAGVHLLEERRGDDGVRRWVALADARFERPAVVGTGGLAVELTTAERADPEVLVALGGLDAGAGQDARLGSQPARGATSSVLVARRDGVILGAARADAADGALGRRSAVLLWLGVESDSRRQGVARHLLDRLEHCLARDGAEAVEVGEGHVPGPVEVLLEGRGWTGPGLLRKKLAPTVSAG